MSRLYEYQGKELLRREGFSTPYGIIAGTVAEVKQAVAQIGPPVVLKAQLLQTGRGKAGGIRVCNNAGQARDAAKELFSGSMKGDTVRSLLVEKRIEFDQEFFVGVTLDDRTKTPVLMISAKGGVDVEEMAAKNPTAIGRIDIDYLNGLHLADAGSAVAALAFPPEAKGPLATMLVRLADMFKRYEMMALEINPLFFSVAEGLIAGDCKICVDDYANFRHPEYQDMIDIPRELTHAPTRLERIAWLVEKDDYRGTFYFSQLVDRIEEKGFIGYHGGGGGGGMAGMDKLHRLGLRPACYVDTSGNPPGSKVYRAVKIILSIPGIQGYLLFSDAVANQDLTITARAIIKAVREMRPAFPAIVRLIGNGAEESQRLVREAAARWELNLEFYGLEKTTTWCIEQMKQLMEAR